MARIRQAEKIDALRTIPLFQELSKKELEFLARMTTEVAVKDGTHLVTQGELGREAMIIVSGTAVVRRNGRKIDSMGPGDFFGEMSLVNHIPRNADVIASSDVRVLVMHAGEFANIFEQFPKVAVKILRTVVERLVETQKTGV